MTVPIIKNNNNKKHDDDNSNSTNNFLNTCIFYLCFQVSCCWRLKDIYQKLLQICVSDIV